MIVCDNFIIPYDERPCDIYIKNVAASMIKGRHLKRNIYLEIMSIGLSDLIWKVFATVMNLTNKKNKTLNFFADPIFISINCDLRYLIALIKLYTGEKHAVL